MYRRKILAGLAILAVLALIPACNGSGSGSSSYSGDGASGGSQFALSYATTIADARVAARQALAASGAPSCTVGLSDGERVIWSEAFGRIDDRGTAPTAETMFAIGSTSKVFAALAVMRLVDQGRVDLDAPLVRYLPDFRMASPGYNQVTVRMLLPHASGFPGGDYRGDTTFAPNPGFSAQVQQTLAGERLKDAPGFMAT